MASSRVAMVSSVLTVGGLIVLAAVAALAGAPAPDPLPLPQLSPSIDQILPEIYNAATNAIRVEGSPGPNPSYTPTDANQVMGAIYDSGNNAIHVDLTTTNPSTGNCLIWNGTAWEPGACATGSGAGTVTSAALIAPAFLSVSGSPITTSGTFAITLATQAANTFFAGPSSGSAAAPTFRALVAADVPALNYQAPLSTYAAPANEFITGFTSPNSFTAAQPSFANLSGSPTAAQLAASPASGECLGYSGSALQWQACGSGGPGTPGGANTAVQFNNAGAFGGDATNFYYNSSTHALTTTGAITGASITTTGSGAGYFSGTEGTCPAAVAGQDILCASSTEHGVMASYNGGTYAEALLAGSNAQLNDLLVQPSGSLGTASVRIFGDSGGDDILRAVTNAGNYGLKIDSSGSVWLGQQNTPVAGALNIFDSSGHYATIQTATIPTSYNFNLPSSAGTSGQCLTSGGGGSAAMTWASCGSGGALPSYWLNDGTHGSLGALPNGDDATPLWIAPAPGVTNNTQDLFDVYTGYLSTPSAPSPSLTGGGSIPSGDVVTVCTTISTVRGQTPCSTSTTSSATTAATVAPPSTPSFTFASGGTIATSTPVTVEITYCATTGCNEGGYEGSYPKVETTASAASTQTTSAASQEVQITSPATASGAAGYGVYACTGASCVPVFQTATAIGTATTLTTIYNTSGSPGPSVAPTPPAYNYFANEAVNVGSPGFESGAISWSAYAAACASPGPCTGLTLQYTNNSFAGSPSTTLLNSISTGGAAPPSVNTAAGGEAFGVTANGSLNLGNTYSLILGGGVQQAAFERLLGGVGTSSYMQFLSAALPTPAPPQAQMLMSGGAIGTQSSYYPIRITYTQQNPAGQTGYDETAASATSYVYTSGCSACEISITPPAALPGAQGFNVYMLNPYANPNQWLLVNSSPVTNFTSNYTITAAPTGSNVTPPTGNTTGAQYQTTISAAPGASGLACVNSGVPGYDCAPGTFIATNPMTSVGDLTIGGTVNAEGVAAPTVLHAGTSGQVLTSNGPNAAPSWQAGGGGGVSVVFATSATETAASVPSTTMVTPAANHVYRLGMTILQSAVATSTGCTLTVYTSWTDAVSGLAVTNLQLPEIFDITRGVGPYSTVALTSTSGNLPLAAHMTTELIDAKASDPVTYSVAYAGSCGSPAYTVQPVLEQLQ